MAKVYIPNQSYLRKNIKESTDDFILENIKVG